MQIAEIADIDQTFSCTVGSEKNTMVQNTINTIKHLKKKTHTFIASQSEKAAGSIIHLGPAEQKASVRNTYIEQELKDSKAMI